MAAVLITAFMDDGVTKEPDRRFAKVAAKNVRRVLW